jgi:SnoaL-like domain
VSLFRKLRDERDYFVQFAVQGSVEINGDEATARCVCHEAARGPGESYYRNNGVWTDRLRRSDNGWVFTSRTYQCLWLDLSPFPGTSSQADARRPGRRLIAHQLRTAFMAGSSKPDR